MTERLSKPLVISSSLHLAVAALIFLRAVFMPSEPIDLRSAIRVDIVGLPQKMEDLPAAAAPAPSPPREEVKVETKSNPVEAKPEPKSKAPSVPVKSAQEIRKSQSDALKKLKQMSATERIKKELEAERRAAGPVAGAEKSEGDALRGIPKLDYDRYSTVLRERVHSNWQVPQWLTEANFKARIKIYIDESGFVIKKEFVLPSGNEAFDATVLEALERSSPFPPPPDNIRNALRTSGAIFNFPE